MARVTVEDCIKVVPNRFELVLLAARRAREISSGAPLAVQRDNDKNSVVSLREISDDVLPLDQLRQNLIKSMQRAVFLNTSSDTDIDEEVTDEMQTEGMWQSGEALEAMNFEDAQDDDIIDDIEDNIVSEEV